VTNRRTWVMSLSLLAALGGIDAVRPALVHAGAPRNDELLPPRFHVAESVERRFLDLLNFSPTFRAQCRRIVDAEVRVVIEVGTPWDFEPQIRGKSLVVRDDAGAVRFVRMKLRRDADLSVLLPHEMEHVLEQLEGVDLASLSKQINGGAWRVGPHAYETRRAELAGHVVDREYRRHVPVDTRVAR